ncbi:MAG: S9 family peptidase [Cyclobacteriaceae bacterium]
MKTSATFFLIALPFFVFSQKQITVEDIYKDKNFTQKSLKSLNWMNDGQFYTALIANKIEKFDVKTGEKVGTIVNGVNLGININDYTFSSDEKKLILLTEKQKIYRRSYTGEYYIYQIDKKALKKVSQNGRQSYVTFSPANDKVAFARDNNLFYVNLKDMAEYAVTVDGESGKIINGSSDWVYEEELRLTKAFAWSPDGKKLAYIKFDESRVREYNLQYWDKGSKYPRDYRFKYPKAGEKVSDVSVHIYHLDTKKGVVVDVGKGEDFYIPKIQWTKNPNLLSVMRLNRLQKRLDVFHSNANNGSSLLLFYERAEKYLNVYEAHDLIYLDNGSQFIFSATERDGYKHFYLHNIDGQHIGAITKGGWEVDKFIALDQSKKTPVMYYTSTEVSPLERHVYKVDINGKGKTKLSETPGMNTMDISKDFKYYILFNESATRPKSVALKKGNKLIDTLVYNNKLIEKAEEYDIRQREFHTFEATDGTPLNGYFLKPADFDSTRQYPVLIYQYSGPGKQKILNEWEGKHFYWHQLLVQKGYVVAAISTRGTNGRGEAFKKQTYRQMGTLETSDLITSAKYLGGLPYFDKDRIGIWGWSYGGYISTVAMMKGSSVFKACISVAPFSWEHYDAIYSERYMQRPEDNPDGYEESSLFRYAEKLRGKYLLIHGTGDDNVHYQVSMNLVDKLVQEGKQFQTFFYPDKDHGIAGTETKVHLYKMMTEFIESNL